MEENLQKKSEEEDKERNPGRPGETWSRNFVPSTNPLKYNRRAPIIGMTRWSHKRGMDQTEARNLERTGAKGFKDTKFQLCRKKEATLEHMIIYPKAAEEIDSGLLEECSYWRDREDERARSSA